MTLRVAILLTLLIQYTEGLQREYAHIDDSFSDNVDATRATRDENGSGNYITTTVCVVCMTILLSTLTGLYNELVHLTSNSLINITHDVTISSIIQLVSLSNITLMGHNSPTVYCNNYGGLHLMSCNNCTLEGITWKGCGGRKNNESKKIHPVLQLSNSSDIVIKYCWIQNSLGQAVALSGMSGDIIIEHCNFSYNKQYRGHGTAIHYSSSISYVNLTITKCEFSSNSDALSVVYFGPSFTNSLHTSDNSIKDSIFYYNIGTPIYLSSQKLDIRGKLQLNSNTAISGGAIYISDYSEVIFQNTTLVDFMYNRAHTNGGAIYLTNHSRILFKDHSKSDSSKIPLTFYQNRAGQYGKDICVHHSYVTFSNNAIVTLTDDRESTTSAVYIDHYSSITFEGNSEVTFDNNEGTRSYGGALYIENSCAAFKANSTVIFNHNEADSGGAMYITTNAIVVIEGNARMIFNNNIASYGGGIYIEDYSTVTFKGNSTVIFNSNYGTTEGGAIHITGRSIVKFKENSTVKLNSNTADYGGAVYIAQYPTIITFEDDSKITFNNNQANFDGGAIHIGKYSEAIVTFKGNSIVLFNSNIASHDGGAFLISHHANSPLTFEENSRVFFSNNTANSGGAVYSFCSCATTKHIIWFTGRSTTIFDGNQSKNKGGAVCADSSDISPFDNCYPIRFDDDSKVTFTRNEAAIGGAIYVGFNINTKSLKNSTITFMDNKARMGGAIFSYAYHITIQGNSHATFNNNVALQNGGVLFCYAQCNISFTKHSTVTFTHNQAAQGGVIHIQFNSAIKFQGNSIISFIENKANENGGVIHSYINSYIEFDDYTNVLLKSNTAKTGGTMNLILPLQVDLNQR